MPPESPKMSQEPIDAMADCVFPEDIMLCIVTRLPVKSILRFKSVCKPWCELFSTPEFIKMHHGQFSSDPKNQSFIVHRVNKNSSNTMSLFSIESNVKKLTILDHPFSSIHLEIDTMGCCNGLVCLYIPPFGQIIVLWNPAMKLSMELPSSKVDFGAHQNVSLGFGYDAQRADFKVVRIFSSKMGITGVEVYSVNSDSWRTIEVDFQFNVLQTKNVVIVNGNPYWVAKVDRNDSAKSEFSEVLVCFDVTKLVFKIVPLSTLYMEVEEAVGLVDWNGSLGGLVCTIDNERVKSVDGWVFDDGEQIWRKDYTFGPIEVNMDRLLWCSKNGKILGERADGKLFVFDPKTGCVKFLFYAAQRPQSFRINRYAESLSYMKGMRQVNARRKRKMVDDATRGT
ncbi:hypothetical protein DH2020_048258 [Rehmannia glutinosa]|uniref:F-box domain-containing protein n=1 Tax=Rehmannia glutinosa TaxID=99300 RepID=A0ABR0U656_REHGL